MKIGLPLAVLAAAIAWVILYVVIGIPLWVAFVVAAAIIVLGIGGAGAQRASS